MSTQYFIEHRITLIEGPQRIADHFAGITVMARFQMSLQACLLRPKFNANCFGVRHGFCLSFYLVITRPGIAVKRKDGLSRCETHRLAARQMPLRQIDGEEKLPPAMKRRNPPLGDPQTADYAFGSNPPYKFYKLFITSNQARRRPYPTGKSVGLRSPSNFGLSSPFGKDISVFPKYKSGYMICHPVPKEGRCATSSTRDGTRWTLMAPLTKALEADGEGVWS